MFVVSNMKIELLGTNCPKCKLLEENLNKAILELNLKVKVIKITEIGKIIEYGVMSAPAIVINGEVKCYGRVANSEEIKKWL